MIRNKLSDLSFSKPGVPVLFGPNKTSRSNKHLSFTILLTFVLSGLSSFYAAITHRPLMHDGAAWYYLIITKGSTRDFQYRRYFTLVLEWPATLLIRFFPNIDIKAIIYTLDFAFAF